MPLPALQATPDARSTSERVNRLTREFNREDTRVPVYALDTGSATAYVIAPVPGIEQYVVGQIFVFKAANANSGTAPTLAVNGLSAGTITYPNGGALVAGDIPANSFVAVVVASTTPTFHLQTRSVLPAIPIANTGATTFLGGDVAVNNIANFFNGPNTGSIGANGEVWLITANICGRCTGAASGFALRIFDGSAAVIGGSVSTPAANNAFNVTLSAVVTLTGATTFTAQVRDPNRTDSVILTTGHAAGSPANKATSITAVRLA